MDLGNQKSGFSKCREAGPRGPRLLEPHPIRNPIPFRLSVPNGGNVEAAGVSGVIRKLFPHYAHGHTAHTRRYNCRTWQTDNKMYIKKSI